MVEQKENKSNDKKYQAYVKSNNDRFRFGWSPPNAGEIFIKARLRNFTQQVIEWNEVLRKNPNQKDVDLQAKLVKEEWENETQKAIKQEDTIETIDGLCDTFVVLSYYHYLVFGGYWDEVDFYENTVCSVLDGDRRLFLDCMDEVLKSNWSKFPTVDLISDAVAECKWIEQNRSNNERAYTGVTFKKVSTSSGDRYVFTDSNGKIMKPSTFVEPDLESILIA